MVQDTICLDCKKYLIFNPKAESHSAFGCFECFLALSRTGLSLPASDMTQYVCKSFALLELCDYMIYKTELHKRDAAENVLKFSDLPLSFLCESDSQVIKLINLIICYVYFNDSQKYLIIKFEEKSSSFFIALFSVRLRGQQLEIMPPHFTVFHHIYHFVWVKS